MNNIYVKTVHKEYSTPHELYTQLHQLGSLRALKASPTVSGAEPQKL